jgi:hypothetical protein
MSTYEVHVLQPWKLKGPTSITTGDEFTLSERILSYRWAVIPSQWMLYIPSYWFKYNFRPYKMDKFWFHSLQKWFLQFNFHPCKIYELSVVFFYPFKWSNFDLVSKLIKGEKNQQSHANIASQTFSSVTWDGFTTLWMSYANLCLNSRDQTVFSKF